MCFSLFSGSHGVHWSCRGARDSRREGKIAHNELLVVTSAGWEEYCGDLSFLPAGNAAHLRCLSSSQARQKSFTSLSGISMHLPSKEMLSSILWKFQLYSFIICQKTCIEQSWAFWEGGNCVPGQGRSPSSSGYRQTCAKMCSEVQAELPTGATQDWDQACTEQDISAISQVQRR